jgi:DoxX-like family
MPFANPRVSGNIPFPMEASLTAPRVAQKSWTLWAGWSVSAIVAAFMIFSAFLKLTHNPQAVQGFSAFGLGTGALTVIGIVELGCVVLFLVPPTAALGAVLLAAYFGGAVMAHLVMHIPIPIPIVFGVVAWAGLYLREPRVRALFPLTRTRR